MFRTFLLLKIHLLSFFHKLRHDFIREIVVGFCSLVLLGLFYYVFDDFLNVEVAKLSLAMRDRFAEALAWGILLVGAFFGGRWTKGFFVVPSSLFNRIALLGESPTVLRCLGVFHVIIVLASVFGPLWWFVDGVLIDWKRGKALAVFLVMLTLSSVSWLLKEPAPRDWQDKPSLSFSPLLALVQWRLRQIFFRNRVSQFCLGLSFLFTGVSLLAGFSGFPFVAVFCSSYIVGSLGACALAFQFSEDIQVGWVEKNLGISHEFYMHALSLSSIVVALLLAVCNSLAWSAGALSVGETQVVENGLKALTVTFIPGWMVPFAFFQIDARRPALTILVTFLSGLFVATAIYASWFSMLLLPLIVYYGYQSQEGRFYRA